MSNERELSEEKFDVCIIGAGIIGMTTAERLHREKLKVCVIDRHSTVARETSFVSSGQLEPKRVDHLIEYSDPTALGIQGLATIMFGFPRWTLNYLNYEMKMKMNPSLSDSMTRDIHELGRLGMVAAAAYSKIYPSVFKFGRSSITNKAAFPMNPADASFLTEKDDEGEEMVSFRSHQIASGSPFDLCTLLQKKCERDGTSRFVPNCNFTGFELESSGDNGNRKVKAINTSQGKIHANKFIFCTGIATDQFFPLLPMWGIIREYEWKSKSKGLFGTEDVVMSTLPKPKPGQQSYVVLVENDKLNNGYAANTSTGRTLRLGGGAEVSLHKPALSAFAPILERITGHGKPLRDWIGCRAVSPDGAPVIGLLPSYSNAYVNCGQSFWGWTLSFGSAEVIADHLVHKKDIPATFNPARFLFSGGTDSLARSCDPGNE